MKRIISSLFSSNENASTPATSVETEQEKLEQAIKQAGNGFAKLRAVTELASYFSTQDRYLAAEQQGRRAYQLALTLNIPSNRIKSSILADILRGLIFYLECQNKTEEALTLAKERVKQAHFSHDQAAIDDALFQQAYLKQDITGMELFSKRAQKDADASTIIFRLEKLVCLYKTNNNIAECIKLQQQIFSLIKNLNAHEQAAKSGYNLAVSLVQAGREQEADKVIREALAIPQLDHAIQRELDAHFKLFKVQCLKNLANLQKTDPSKQITL